MRPVVHAIVEHKVTSVSLHLVPFLVLLEKLEPSAKDAKDENIKRIPAIKLLNFMRSMTRSDITIRASCEMPSEAGGFTPFATDVVQCVRSDGQGTGAAAVGRCSEYSGWTIERR